MRIPGTTFSDAPSPLSAEDRLKRIKELWTRWKQLDAKRLYNHKPSCGYLYGSRPENGDCDCGKFEIEGLANGALADLTKEMEELP